MKQVLYNTHVLLDVLLKREPHFSASAAALDAVGQGKKVEGYIAGHAVTTLDYLLTRQLDSKKSRIVLSELLAKMRVAPVTDAVIRQALNSPFSDFEDAVCHAAALEAGISVIVTRNIGNFAKGTLPAVLPELFRAE
ncbi:MAG: PIN domain-containing protein [Gammaproteobacteria bacterium]|nr:PIN domain-containing protein [Gammaproteobacteria bacterium]